MAPGSLRELSSALCQAFDAPAVSPPLPDELHHSIDVFLDRCHDAEEHDAERFHTELNTVYTRYVQGSPEKSAAWISVLRRVRPALAAPSLKEWWTTAVKPVIEKPGHKRQDIEEAGGFVLDILAYDADEDRDGEHARLSKAFADELLGDYLARTRILTGERLKLSPENEFITQELEEILVAFGRQKPKDFLLALDHLFLQAKHRVQVLNLLSSYVRLQPPHLYRVLETPLIDHLEKCLLIDTSSTVIELALMILIMFLPHITASLTSEHHLAKLFLIYSRILCWDKFVAPRRPTSFGEEAEKPEEHEIEEEMEEEQCWEKVPHSQDEPESSPPTLLHYFTFLYGLFPLNFMSYLRKPAKYLRTHNFPDAEDFDLDQDLIQTRSEPLRRVHLLHPNAFKTTIDDELTENLWLKADPADIVTDCMELCVAVSSTLDDPGPPPASALPPLPVASRPGASKEGVHADQEGTEHAADSSASGRNTPSSSDQPEDNATACPGSDEKSSVPSPLLKPKDPIEMDSPTLPPVKEKEEPLIGATLVGSQQGDTSPYRLESFTQAVTAAVTSYPPSDAHNKSMASLQREIMLLRNDLNFERYLKQQHLTHIGQLQRRHIKEAADAAETQNLIMANRTLKARLAKANELYAQLKKETLTSRSQSKKWEAELSAKVRSYREESKTWRADEDQLRFDLAKSEQDCEDLKTMVQKAEAELLITRQRTQQLEFELENFKNVRRDLEAKQEEALTYKDRSRELDALLHQRDQLRNDLEVANMRLNSREHERGTSLKAYERRVRDLEARLQAASEKSNTAPNDQLPANIQQMVDCALAASNTKLQQLKKVHQRLLERYTELEMRLYEVEGDKQAEQGPSSTAGPAYRPKREDSNRDINFRQPGYDPHYQSPGSPSQQPHAHQDQLSDHLSPHTRSPASPSAASSSTASAATSTLRPVRLEHLHSKRSASAAVPFAQNFSGCFEAGSGPTFPPKSSSTSGALGGNEHMPSRAQSAHSVETSSSKGDKKEKVAPKSEVRIYGRGGAQNIGKKVKEKDKEKDKDKDKDKRTGFRGLRGIM